MIDRIWLITDVVTGDVSYVRHGHQDDESAWKTIGPFGYTTREKAVEASLNPKFLPKGVTGDFLVRDVEASGFVQAIFNGFPSSDTDVFVVNDSPFPLTRNGAEWVDEAIGHPLWGPLFDEDGGSNGLTWLDKVLQQVADSLEMGMETVRVIGTLNAVTEDVEADVDQMVDTIQQHVQVLIIPEAGTLVVGGSDDHHHLSPASDFWLHTNGMSVFGLPELEIRNVPCWWVTAAGAELNGWAAYSLDKGMSEGDLLDGGGPVPLKLQVVSSDDPFWQERNQKCLRLEVAHVLFAHSHQKHGTSDVTDTGSKEIPTA